MTPQYFIIPLIEEFQTLPPDSDKARTLAAKIAANIGDTKTRLKILGTSLSSQIHTPNPQPSTPEAPVSSFDTIDSFLDKFGKNLAPVGYVPQPSTAQPSPSPSSPQNTPLDSDQTPIDSQQSTLSSLIKSGRFDEALQFINSQNLNNPKKSIYFAHQMRFLKKLIALQSYKTKS